MRVCLSRETYGLVFNVEKSVWEPAHIVEWLEFPIDFDKR